MPVEADGVPPVRQQKAVEAEIVFKAPMEPGTYTLRAHITSTAVIGVSLQADVKFTVVEDDVPELQ